MRISDRLRSNKNIFKNPSPSSLYDVGSWKQNTRLINYTRRDSIVSSLFTRIAIDASSTDIQHVIIDPDNLNQIKINSNLQEIFSTEANIDESNLAFIYNMVYSLLDEGRIAVVPTDWEEYVGTSDKDPITLRVCKIVKYNTKTIDVQVYNDETGMEQMVTVNKREVAIIESPLYEILNSPNGTLSRLIKKMNMLDNSDDISASGKIDLIFQFKQAIKTDDQIKKANEHMERINKSLESNRYGAAWVDGTEDWKQLNRPINDGLPQQVKDLTIQFFNQIGVTENVLNGTANEAEMRGYYTRIIDPILLRIAAEFKRAFIPYERREKGEQLIPYRDPFKLVPVSQIAEVADKFRRNAVLSANEIRAIVGRGPDPDPVADLLTNPNIADVNQNPGSTTPPDPYQNGGNYREEVVE